MAIASNCWNDCARPIPKSRAPESLSLEELFVASKALARED